MKPLKPRSLALFFEPLSMLLHTGISPLEGISLLLEDCSEEQTRTLLNELIQGLEESGSLSAAMEKTNAFPPAAVSYTALGEETGTLDEVLNVLFRQYEEEASITSQIRSALTYPLLMLGMIGAVILVLFIKVLPVFQQVFHSLGMEMNSFSMGMLRFGQILEHFSIVFLILILLLALVLLWLFFTSRGKRYLAGRIQKIPVVKTYLLSMDYSRLTHGLYLGIRSGVGMEESLRLVSSLLTSDTLKTKTEKIREQLFEGALFTESMKEQQLFTEMDLRLISLSDRTGNLDEIMERMSKRYREQAIHTIEHVLSILEPTMVILLSVIVGLVLLSVMLPLLGILSGGMR